MLWKIETKEKLKICVKVGEMLTFKTAYFQITKG